jgi:tetratricopeptide (TPR) repeat protein
MLRAGLLRKAARFAEAKALVKAALDAQPDWHTATALGLILREQGDWKEAEQAFKLALRLDPRDVSARLEAGDMFFQRMQWQAALDWYENALDKEPKQPWAQPSALFCRWKLTDEEKPLKALLKLGNQGNHRAQYLCNRAFGHGLPEPTDATANLVRQLSQSLEEDPDNFGDELSLTLNCLEAPSNYLAFQMQLTAQGKNPVLNLTVERVPKPDPRQPIGAVRYPLWHYDGTEAAPALPPPPEDVVETVADLAMEPYDDQLNWATASRIAEALGPGRVGEVLAVMVHPPPVPAGLTALAWLPRVQLAAAQVAAQVDEGWDGSVRQAALLSVLHGPRDWATEAAIRVLARLGVEQEALAPDIHDAFQQLADHRPDQGHWGWVRTLFQCWLDLPHLYPSEREAMEQELAALDEAAAED